MLAFLRPGQRTPLRLAVMAVLAALPIPVRNPAGKLTEKGRYTHHE
jgi:hypothetical protein